MLNEDVSGLEALHLATRTLDELEIDYWVCNGSLLGLVRDGRLIPWDTDVDIGIFNKGVLSRVEEPLVKAGARLCDKGKDSDYFIFEYRGVKIDFNVFQTRGRHLETLWKVSRSTIIARVAFKAFATLKVPHDRVRDLPLRLLWTYEGYGVPCSMVTPTKRLQLDHFSVRVPRAPEAVLEHIYGADWRTPKTKYDWRTEGANNASSSFR